MHECTKRGAWGALLLIAVLACGCEGNAEPVADPPYVPRPVAELQRFELRQDGRVLGTAVKFEIQDEERPVVFWRFLKRNGAWLGHASAEGRFSRRVPFADCEEDLGLWPMATGAAQLLGVNGPVELAEVPVARPASARRGGR